MEYVTNKVSTANVRYETQHGRKYAVTDVVAAKPMELNGGYVPEWAFQISVPEWNRVPLPIGHPTNANGDYISSRLPEVVENAVVGDLYNVSYNQDARELRGELWIDVEKARDLGGYAERALEMVENGETLEVSTAYRAEEGEPGVYDGAHRERVRVNLKPDHLALLPDDLGPGRCSAADGCGTGQAVTNTAANSETTVPQPPMAGYRVSGDAGTAAEQVYLNMQPNHIDQPRDPEYSGTNSEDGDWERPPLSAYIEAYYNRSSTDDPDDLPSSVSDLPDDAKQWIAQRSLIGDPDAESYEELLFYPVVTPNNTLSADALDAVLSANADIPDDLQDSVRQKARDLLEDEFDRSFDSNADESDSESSDDPGDDSGDEEIDASDTDATNANSDPSGLSGLVTKGLAVLGRDAEQSEAINQVAQQTPGSTDPANADVEAGGSCHCSSDADSQTNSVTANADDEGATDSDSDSDSDSESESESASDSASDSASASADEAGAGDENEEEDEADGQADTETDADADTSAETDTSEPPTDDESSSDEDSESGGSDTDVNTDDADSSASDSTESTSHDSTMDYDIEALSNETGIPQKQLEEMDEDTLANLEDLAASENEDGDEEADTEESDGDEETETNGSDVDSESADEDSDSDSDSDSSPEDADDTSPEANSTGEETVTVTKEQLSEIVNERVNDVLEQTGLDEVATNHQERQQTQRQRWKNTIMANSTHYTEEMLDNMDDNQLEATAKDQQPSSGTDYGARRPESAVAGNANSDDDDSGPATAGTMADWDEQMSD